MKVSPFVILGLVFYILLSLFRRKGDTFFKKENWLEPALFLFVFYLGYFIVMSLPTKKLDRYMIPIFPLLTYFSVLGYQKFYSVFSKMPKFSASVIAGLFLLFVAYPDVKDFPYLFTYTSPVFGTAENANKVIAQKPFGIGILELKDSIVKKYGSEAKLGFLDVKPIEAIYPNSQVFDMRVTGPGGYDYAVLGINEVLPEKVLNDARFTFVKDYSIWINGLEYWRVYVKKAK
jgi:hypothetical protein